MLKKAIICLRLGSIFTLFVGAYLIHLAAVDTDIVLSGVIALIVVCIAMIFWFEFTIKGLKNIKIWAWKSSIVIFGLFIPSLYIIIGWIGMQSVLSNTVREQFFGENKTVPQNNGKSFADIMSEAKNIKNDENIDEYIESNNALKRYLNYKNTTEENN